MADLSLVYRKTAHGILELTAKAQGLNREQRNLLFVADGRRALSALCSVGGCDPHRWSALADDLLALGLIEPVVPVAGSAHVGDEVAEAGDARPDPAALRARLADLAQSVFGADAGPLLERIEKAEGTHAGLIAAAERAATLAKLTIDERRAGAFLDEVHRLLER